MTDIYKMGYGVQFVSANKQGKTPTEINTKIIITLSKSLNYER